MIRDVLGDAQTAAAYLAVLQVLAAVVLCIVGRSDAPPVRHAARGCPRVPADVLTVPRAPDEWPINPADTVPTRPMLFRPPATVAMPFPEPVRRSSWVEPA